jgi:hypothetical protein
MRINHNILIIPLKMLLLILISGIVIMSGYTQGSEEPLNSAENNASIEAIERGELTAREAYQLAQAEAAKWASDAVLVDISNFRGTSLTSGRSVRWKLEFNSKSMNMELEVHVSRGEILQIMDEKLKKREAISGEWMDTPRALNIALEYFTDKPIKNYWFGISSKEGIMTWYIKCRYEEGVPTWVHINALTGEVIKTREGY